MSVPAEFTREKVIEFLRTDHYRGQESTISREQ